MCLSITWLPFSRFLSLLESYCSSNSLIVDINDDFLLFASWFEMCKKVCLAMLFSWSDSRCNKNFSMPTKIFNFRESRPVSLRATTSPDNICKI